MKKKDIEIKILDKYTRNYYDPDSISSRIQTSKIIHGGGHQYHIKEKYLHTPLEKIKTELVMLMDDIVKFNLEKFCSQIRDMADYKTQSIDKLLINSICQTTKLTGNEYDAKCQAYNYDMILDVYEGYDFTFDEKGNPEIPTLICPPQLAEKINNTKVTQNQIMRYNAIIEKKRSEYYAKKCYRKLSYRN